MKGCWLQWLKVDMWQISYRKAVDCSNCKSSQLDMWLFSSSKNKLVAVVVSHCKVYMIESRVLAVVVARYVRGKLVVQMNVVCGGCKG